MLTLYFNSTPYQFYIETKEEAINLIDTYLDTVLKGKFNVKVIEYYCRANLLIDYFSLDKIYYQKASYDVDDTLRWESIIRRRKPKLKDNNKNNKDRAEMPDETGLYMLGVVDCNPFTDEKRYWIKIGKAINIAKRVMQHRSSNPSIWEIDSLITETAEKDLLETHYHSLMRWNFQIGEARGSKEWFEVNKENYLEFCKKGFKIFKNLD